MFLNFFDSFLSPDAFFWVSLKQSKKQVSGVRVHLVLFETNWRESDFLGYHILKDFIGCI